MNTPRTRPIEMLMIEDNPDDVELTIEALKDTQARINVSAAGNGVEAMEFLRRQGRFADAPRPDLILLDLNLPRRDGREVLRDIKTDPQLRHIPVMILTTSSDEDDVLNAYRSYVNCYITKPVDFDQYMEVIQAIELFWLRITRLPPKE